MIHLEKVEKSYPLEGGRTWVLRNVDLDIAEGEFVSVMGPSGAGKSSLLNVLGLMDHDWQGAYTLDGVEVGKLNGKQRQALQREKIGFIFQHYHLIDDLKVWENLDLPLQYRDVPAKERAARVADLLDRFQIVGKKDLFPPALGRPAATGRRGPRGDHATAPAARRRTDRCPAFGPGPHHHGPARRTARGRHDHHPGHPQRALRQRGAAHREFTRRLDRESRMSLLAPAWDRLQDACMRRTQDRGRIDGHD